MQTLEEKDQYYLNLYQRGVQAESALAYLNDFFPKRREQLNTRFKTAPVEQLPLIRELILEVDKIEVDMKNAVLSGERAIQKSLAN